MTRRARNRAPEVTKNPPQRQRFGVLISKSSLFDAVPMKVNAASRHIELDSLVEGAKLTTLKLSMGTPTVAFVGQGKLMICRPGKEPEPVESAFVQRIRDRVERERERHGWRGDGMMWNMMSPIAMRSSMAPSEPVRDARFVSVANGRDGLMLYSIATSQVGGLFEFDPTNNEERRLVHKAGFNAEALTSNPKTGELAFCIRNNDGTAAIGVADERGGKHHPVTEGDSLDECPSWVPGEGRRLVFQSAGIARNQSGVPVDLSSSRIELLDLDAQKMNVLVEDVRFDYLAPHISIQTEIFTQSRGLMNLVSRVCHHWDC